MIRSSFVLAFDIVINLLWLALILAIIWCSCKVINSTLPTRTPRYAPVENFDFDGVTPRMGNDG